MTETGEEAKRGKGEREKDRIHFAPEGADGPPLSEGPPGRARGENRKLRTPDM
jgi:hypothetical protein